MGIFFVLLSAGYMKNLASSLKVGAAQEVVIPQHTEQPASPQAVLKHLWSTVDVSKPCGIDTCCQFLGKPVPLHEGLTQKKS